MGIFLFLISWGLSLAHLLGLPFWDKKYALQKIEDNPAEEIEAGMQNIGKDYYTDRRFPWFVPHVLGAILWWNLYFFQLIPRVRHWKGKKFHRILGRFLMIVLFMQMISGVGLAATSHSNVIKLVSYVLALAAFYCASQAWRYAFWRDIPKHKHWVLRTVGYMQAISLQRFWLLVLIISHKFGWDGLYPQLDEDSTEEEWTELVVHKMFDDSFILCILHAFLSTEWYLAAEQGMTETPINNRGKLNKEESPLQESIKSNQDYGSTEEGVKNDDTPTSQAGEQVEEME